MQRRTGFVAWRPSYDELIEVSFLEDQALYHMAEPLFYPERLQFLGKRCNIAKAYW